MNVMVCFHSTASSKLWLTRKIPRFWTLNHYQKMSHLLMVKNGQERKTRLLCPEYHCFCTLRHLLVWEPWVPLPSPILCYCLRVTEETIAPQKLSSQVKCQMRTGKAGTNLKVMDGETSHSTDLLWWRGCPLGRWKGSINVQWSHEPCNSGIFTSGLFIMCFKVCRRATQKLFLSTANGSNFVFHTLFPHCI